VGGDGRYTGTHGNGNQRWLKPPPISEEPPFSRGVIARSLTATAKIIQRLLLSLLFSILIEWVGMVIWWPDEGLDHSRAMLATEVSYLESDFRRSVVTSDPARFARKIADESYHYLFEVTGFVDLIQWVSPSPRPTEQGIRPTLHHVYRPIADFVLAAMQVTQLFSVRLAILTLAMPVFLLFSLVAFGGRAGAAGSPAVGRGTGEFLRLPLRQEGDPAVGGDHLGGVSGPAVQPASDVCGVAVCDVVCVECGGDCEYVYEIPVDLASAKLIRNTATQGTRAWRTGQLARKPAWMRAVLITNATVQSRHSSTSW
jgi:hypothetical protein